MTGVLVVAGAVVRSDPTPSLLVAQRAYPSDLAGLWELPGGKVETGESPEQALARELCEELNVEVRVADPLAVTVRPKPGLELVAIRAEIVAGTPVAAEHLALGWVDATTLEQMAERGEIVPNDRAWIPELLADLRR